MRVTTYRLTTTGLFGVQVSYTSNVLFEKITQISHFVGLPKSLATVDHINNPDLIAPSSVLRMSINTGESSFFGEKYLVEKVSNQ